MLQPGAGWSIRNALITGGNVPLPEERNDLIVISIGVARLEDESGVGSLFDRRFDNLLMPVVDIALALSSGFCATGTTWDLKVTLSYSLF